MWATLKGKTLVPEGRVAPIIEEEHIFYISYISLSQVFELTRMRNMRSERYAFEYRPCHNGQLIAVILVKPDNCPVLPESLQLAGCAVRSCVLLVMKTFVFVFFHNSNIKRALGVAVIAALNATHSM